MSKAEKPEEREEKAPCEDRYHKHMFSRNIKYLGYTTGDVIRPAVNYRYF